MLGQQTFHGVEFHDGTGFNTICATAIFSVHDLSAGRRVTKDYRLYMHTGGWELEEKIDDEWKRLKAHAQREDVLALLPKGPEHDYDWTWQAFFTALTFYGFGRKDGSHEVQVDWDRYEAERKSSSPEKAQAAWDAKEVRKLRDIPAKDPWFTAATAFFLGRGCTFEQASKLARDVGY
jgi:hypothetical protein